MTPPNRATRGVLAVLALPLLLTGCMQKMAAQPAYHWPDQPTDFTEFTDGRGDRAIPNGTVARGQLNEDAVRFAGRTGREGSDYERYTDEFPFPADDELMERGRERYAVWCAMCHDRTGGGNGMIVKRGYTRPTSYHADRIREAPNGYIFDVITNGHGAMAAYGPHVNVRDRWAIIAYVRALQYSQKPAVDELPEDVKKKLEEAKAAPAAPPAEPHKGDAEK